MMAAACPSAVDDVEAELQLQLQQEIVDAALVILLLHLLICMFNR
jgi:hypothetical protein